MSLYAKQAEAKGEVHQAVMYLLACYRIHDAVRVYQRAAMYRWVPPETFLNRVSELSMVVAKGMHC